MYVRVTKKKRVIELKRCVGWFGMICFFLQLTFPLCNIFNIDMYSLCIVQSHYFRIVVNPQVCV